MKNDILCSVLLCLTLFALFFAIEILYRKKKPTLSLSSAIFRSGIIIITMLFPFFLNHPFAVFAVSAFYCLFIFIVIKGKILSSIHYPPNAISRHILYFAAVSVCYLFYKLNSNLLCYYLPLVTLAVCDPLATLIGNRWPLGRFIIRYNHKTLSGTFSFFLMVLFISSFMLHIMTDLPDETITRKAVLMGTMTSFAEALSFRGFNNLTIPAMVMLALRIQV